METIQDPQLCQRCRKQSSLLTERQLPDGETLLLCPLCYEYTEWREDRDKPSDTSDR